MVKRKRGYWEEYRCGCVSQACLRKKDLPGYCDKHGSGRRKIYTEQGVEVPDGR